MEKMDTREDLVRQQKVYILICPFCKNRFVIPFIYRTHLMAHIKHHSDENLFSCNICPKTHRDIMKIVLHIEKIHSEKFCKNPHSPHVREVENKNKEEKINIISELGNNDSDPFPLKLPY